MVYICTKLTRSRSGAGGRPRHLPHDSSTRDAASQHSSGWQSSSRTLERSQNLVSDPALHLNRLVIYLRYGRRELPAFVSRPMFVGWSILIFTTAYVVQWLFVIEFGWAEAPKYAAFLQNLLMSILFIAMFVARRGPRGQSIVIAVAKWIGTLAPTIVFGALAGSMFILGLGILCSVFDLAYLGLLIWARQSRVLEPVDRVSARTLSATAVETSTP